MNRYRVHTEASNEEFAKACNSIEHNLKNLKKEELLIDVDGSFIQIYFFNRKKIKVLNDYEVDAVYIESDIELNGFEKVS